MIGDYVAEAKILSTRDPNVTRVLTSRESPAPLRQGCSPTPGGGPSCQTINCSPGQCFLNCRCSCGEVSVTGAFERPFSRPTDAEKDLLRAIISASACCAASCAKRFTGVAWAASISAGEGTCFCRPAAASCRRSHRKTCDRPRMTAIYKNSHAYTRQDLVKDCGQIVVNKKVSVGEIGRHLVPSPAC